MHLSIGLWLYTLLVLRIEPREGDRDKGADRHE